MQQQPLLYCNTVDELIECAKLPMHAYPTVEFALRNIELPLSQTDYNWISSNEINLFGIDSLMRDNAANRIARGKNTTGPTFTVDTPTVVTGICVFAYGEPYSTVVEGNQFYPRSAMDNAATIPASPINLRQSLAADGVTPCWQKLLPGGVAGNFTGACPAQLDWGGSTWRFIWAFLNAFRLRFDCPNSAYDTIMNERLVDIGNCCSLIDFSGLSDAKTPHTFIARRLNAVMENITLPTSPATSDGSGTVAEPGYFVPINAEQNADGEITPNRMTAMDAAYGRPAALPAVETWYRLPFPMPLDTNTKIKLILDKAEGDEDYFTRMIDEGVMRSCAGPIPSATGSHFRIDETDHDADDDGGYAGFTNIPGGMVRLGLGLKGFQVREGVCHQFKRALGDKALLAQMLTGGGYSPMVADYSGKYSSAPGCGGVAGPGVDVADKIIDARFGGGIEEVPAGYVGDE